MPFLSISAVLGDLKAIPHTSKIYSRNKRYQRKHVFLKDIIVGCSFKEFLKLLYVASIRKRQKSYVILSSLASHPSLQSQLCASSVLTDTDIKWGKDTIVRSLFSPFLYPLFISQRRQQEREMFTVVLLINKSQTKGTLRNNTQKGRVHHNTWYTGADVYTMLMYYCKSRLN